MKYEILKSINENTFLAKDKDEFVILKRIGRDDIHMYEKLINLNCKNIVRFFEIVETEQGIFVIEEFLKGKTLDELAGEGYSFSETEVMKIILQLCDGLEKVHSMNIVHRDITPSNVMLCEGEIVKIIDFGISRTVKENRSSDTEILGTAGFAAHEQFGFSQTDSRADVYALGVLMNWLLTKGKLPNEVSANGRLENIIKKCTQIDAENRYKSVAMLKKDIEALNGKEYSEESVRNMINDAIAENNKKSSRKIKALIVIICVILVLSAGGMTLMYKLFSSPEKVQPSTSKSTLSSAQTTEVSTKTEVSTESVKTDGFSCEEGEAVIRSNIDGTGDFYWWSVTVPVKNTDNCNLHFYDATVDFIDESGSIVDTIDMVNFYPGRVAPGEIAYLQYDMINGRESDIDYSKCSVKLHYNIEKTADIVKLDVSDVKLVNDEYGEIVASGKITNNSGAPCDDVRVYINLFDENDNIIQVIYSYLDNAIPDNDFSGFKFEALFCKLPVDEIDHYGVVCIDF